MLSKLGTYTKGPPPFVIKEAPSIPYAAGLLKGMPSVILVSINTLLKWH